MPNVGSSLEKRAFLYTLDWSIGWAINANKKFKSKQ